VSFLRILHNILINKNSYAKPSSWGQPAALPAATFSRGRE
jgi:hypothetical protein